MIKAIKKDQLDVHIENPTLTIDDSNILKTWLNNNIGTGWRVRYSAASFQCYGFDREEDALLCYLAFKN